MGQVAVGTAHSVADQLEGWKEETGVDGFNVAYAVTPGTFEEFVEHVIPILQDRGLVRREYEEGTLRKNLFGYDHLPEHHYGKKFSKLTVTK